MFSETQTPHLENKETPQYSIAEIEHDFEYWFREYQELVFVERESQIIEGKAPRRAEALLDFMKDDYFPHLGFIHFAIENNLQSEYSGSEEDKQNYLNQIEQLCDKMEKVANEIVQRYKIEPPTFDMNQTVDEYLKDLEDKNPA